MGDSAYSFSLTTFSRTGKLLQIEYALNAVANGRTCLGICATDGVVIACDKKLPTTLVDVQHVHKIEVITPTSGFCYSGVGPDYRVLGRFRSFCWIILVPHNDNSLSCCSLYLSSHVPLYCLCLQSNVLVNHHKRTFARTEKYSPSHNWSNKPHR